MTWLILTVVAAVMLWRQRSEGVVTVNPLKRGRMALPGEETPEPAANEKADFSHLMDAIQVVKEAAAESQKPGGAKLPQAMGRAVIAKMVKNNQFLEAMDLYRRIYGVDLKTAKAAIDKMALGGE